MGKKRLVQPVQNQQLKKGAENCLSRQGAEPLAMVVLGLVVTLLYVLFRNCVAPTQKNVTNINTSTPNTAFFQDMFHRDC